MTDETQLPTRQAIAAKGKSGKGTVSGKLKVALMSMVWEGLKRPDAAKKAGMSDHGLREALRKPHVKAALTAECQVLRDSHRPRNIHRLAEIRDKADNQPAVQAIKVLEQIGEDQGARFNIQLGLEIRAGYVIDISEAPRQPDRPMIDVTPPDGPRQAPEVSSAGVRRPRPQHQAPEPDPNPVFRPPGKWD
jgi:hypothetical protein